mgnify:FL=1
MKYKYKKIFLLTFTLLYIVLTMVELIKYLKLDSELFGLIYNIINVFIIFLLIPVLYNYKRHYSKARISKLILIILLGLFNSCILKDIIISSMNYVDSSIVYAKNTYIIRSIIKIIMFLMLSIFTFIESKTTKIMLKKTKWLFFLDFFI